MLHQNLSQLRLTKPRIIRGNIPKNVPVVKQSTEFSLNLDQNLFTAPKVFRLIKTHKEMDSSKSYVEELEQEDITVEQFKDQLPLHNQEEPRMNKQVELPEEENVVTYIQEQEKTKLFIVNALSEELSRLDRHSSNMLSVMQQNQQQIDEIQENNKRISESVVKMVKDKQNEDKLRNLEDKLNIRQEFRLQFNPSADLYEVNAQLDHLYEDNEQLFSYADQVMAGLNLQYNPDQEDSDSNTEQ